MQSKTNCIMRVFYNLHSWCLKIMGWDSYLSGEPAKHGIRFGGSTGQLLVGDDKHWPGLKAFSTTTGRG